MKASFRLILLLEKTEVAWILSGITGSQCAGVSFILWSFNLVFIDVLGKVEILVTTFVTTKMNRIPLLFKSC